MPGSAHPVWTGALSLLFLTIGAAVTLVGAGLWGYASWQRVLVSAAPLDERLDTGDTALPPGWMTVAEPLNIFETPERSDPAPEAVDPPLRVGIPSIGVDAPVVALGIVLDAKGRWVWETPKHAVGHHQGTAGPGQPGNMVLSGHISSPIRGEGNVFVGLPKVRLGDEVVIETKRGRYVYRVVTRRIVEAEAADVMEPTEAPVMTLITCYPDWVYSHRLVLTAQPLGFQPGSGA